MKMMKLRKGKFDFLGGNYVLCLRVTVNSFSVNDFHVLSVFSLQCWYDPQVQERFHEKWCGEDTY